MEEVLKKLLLEHPDKVELRLAYSVPYLWELWDIEEYLNEKWRWC